MSKDKSDEIHLHEEYKDNVMIIKTKTEHKFDYKLSIFATIFAIFIAATVIMAILYSRCLKSYLELGAGESSEAASKASPEVICKKKLFLKISQYSQENTCVGVSL